MNNYSNDNVITKETIVKIDEGGNRVDMGFEHMLSLSHAINSSSGKESYTLFNISDDSIPFDNLVEDLQKQAKEQKRKLLEIWKNKETISLIIEKAATDDHPVADLRSKEFTNWRFQLSRRLCVKGFLHEQKVGDELELYIDGFGEDQVVFVSYIKKDQLPPKKRNIIVNELKEILKEGEDINTQIISYLNAKPLKVCIVTVLKDHIIVNYKGLYGTMTASDLFHSKSGRGMDHYRKLQKEDGTMKVYVNTIDSTGNVTFSETRLPELYNNPRYKNQEIGQPKWINDINYLKNLTIGQTIECVVWNYSKSGLFVIFFNNGGYVQSLIPITALTEQEMYQWAIEHPLNSEATFRIVNIDEEQKRITLFPIDVTTPKYPAQVELEKTTTAEVDEKNINEGKHVEVEIVCESRVDQDILYARCGNFRGTINVMKDMPECLRHAKSTDNDKIKREFITHLISLNKSKETTIKLPAIAHIKKDGNCNTYYFSVLEACSKCIEHLNEKDLTPDYREVEVVYSWQKPQTNDRLAILRWHDLYTFFHLDPKEFREFNYEGNWEYGSKLTLWVDGIDQDLSFDTEPVDPRPYWKALKLKVGDFVFVRKIWLSRMGIYRTKVEGCTATILPGFNLDEEQIDYHLKVVLIDKEKQLLILSDGGHQLISTSDIKYEMKKNEDKRNLHLLMPLYKNVFLAEDKGSMKWAIIQTTASAYAFLCAIYKRLNINTFIRLSEDYEAHFNYRNFIFPCITKTENNTIEFEWKGEVIVNKTKRDFEKILLNEPFKEASWFPNQPYDFTCNDLVRCKITKEERDQIQNRVQPGKPKPSVYFTGKILYSNDNIYPLFSFKKPNDHLANNISNLTYPKTYDCRIVLYDVSTNNYIVEFESQRGQIKCRENKELRFLPNEVIKGIYNGKIDPVSHMPCLDTFMGPRKKLEINKIYEANIIGRRIEGIVLNIKEYSKRIFLPNKLLFVTKEQYDAELPATINVRYKGKERDSQKDIFELENPPSAENRPPSGDKYRYDITILSKNTKDYDVYINGGEYNGYMGVLPAKYADFKSSIYTTDQILSSGETIEVIIEKYESNIIVFNKQKCQKYSMMFKKGKIKKGIVIYEDKDKYLISFDEIYGIADKNKKLSVGRSYDFSIIEYVLRNRGPRLFFNDNEIRYNVLLNVEPLLISKGGNQLLAHILDFDNEKIILETGAYNLYASLDNEDIIELFMNRFGKIEIHPGTEVYIVPEDCSIDSLQDGAKVRIIKIKK